MVETEMELSTPPKILKTLRDLAPLTDFKSQPG